ncbi:MAG: linear amide C-N hydrolase [Anaerolineae bacterium]
MRDRGLPTGFLLVALLGLAVLASPARARPSLPEGACTSFCLDNDGQAVFGTNYDNQIWPGLLFVNKRGVAKTGWQAGTDGKYAHWTARYGSVTFVLAGVQMAWAGMNEAGLAISTMWLGETKSPRPDERPPLVSPLWVQYQLDTCATVEEVMANDARVRVVDAVDHYLVCDRSGACAAVEFLQGGTVFHTGDDLPVEALTNDAYQKSVAAWRTGRLGGNALQRFGLAADGVAAFRPGDVDAAVTYAFDLLERASGQATGGSPTQWSIVFDLAQGRVHWRTSRHRDLRSVDLARLDLSCDSPAQMLDIHAPLAGDVSDRLEPFDFQANLQYTLDFLDQWGNRELSPLEVEVLQRGLASFSCAPSTVPYQEERTRLLSPLVGWAALALFHRLWPLGLVAGLAAGAVVTRRVWIRRRHR